MDMKKAEDSCSISSTQISSGQPIFQLKGLNFGYDENEPILININLALYSGQILGISGKNGSGKTTLFRCITGLNKPWSGEIIFHGQLLRNEKEFVALRKKVGFSLQNAEDQIFFATVLEDVSFGPLNLGLDQKAAEQMALIWLNMLGLADLASKQIAQLSGGQQKLVALAGIFAMEPEALLLDEPFNALDSDAVNKMIHLLRELPAAKIVVCHDEMLLRRICTKIVHLEKGQLVAE